MNKYPRCASQSGNITAKHIIKSVMRTIVLLLTFGLTTVMANDTFSQTRMNIKVEQVSLENLLNEIQRNSKFIFFYRDDILPKGEKVSVAKEDATLESILKPVLNRF